MDNYQYLLSAERKYAILLAQYDVAEEPTEVIIGMKALAEADATIQAKRKKLKVEMERIADTIRRLCDPEWTPGHIRPLHQRRQKHQMGIQAKTAYRVLREQKRPLSSWELARLVAQRLEVVDGKAIERIANGITTTMERRVKKGQIEKVGEKPVRWTIRPPASTSSASGPPTPVQSAA